MKHLSIIEAMNHPRLFGSSFKGPSWDNWRTVLKATTALPLSETELAFFQTVAERDPPKRPVRQVLYLIGRRGGKDSIASVLTAHGAAFFQHGDKLRRGERALCAAISCDKEQSKILLGYTRAFFHDVPPLKAMTTRETATGFELNNDVDITCVTNSFRAVRGRPILRAVLDEAAYYRDEASANPDTELYNAILPGMATLPDAMLVVITTPYKKSGLAFKMFSDHYGRNDDDVLVIRAPSLTMNPTLDPSIVEQALRDDPDAARAEWLAEFRTDLAGLIGHAALMACVTPGRGEIPPVPNAEYVCFVDPASGTIGGDSFTAAVAHREEWSERVILDAVREYTPPFSVDDCIMDVVGSLCRPYRINRVVGDHWSGDFVRQRFNAAGMAYEVSSWTKSEIYLEFLPLINSARAVLLDDQRMISQALNLERRIARGSGKETVDHSARGRDDKINSCAAALVLANKQSDNNRTRWIGVEPNRPRGGYNVPGWLA